MVMHPVLFDFLYVKYNAYGRQRTNATLVRFWRKMHGFGKVLTTVVLKLLILFGSNLVWYYIRVWICNLSNEHVLGWRSRSQESIYHYDPCTLWGKNGHRKGSFWRAVCPNHTIMVIYIWCEVIWWSWNASTVITFSLNQRARSQATITIARLQAKFSPWKKYWQLKHLDHLINLDYIWCEVT